MLSLSRTLVSMAVTAYRRPKCLAASISCCCTLCRGGVEARGNVLAIKDRDGEVGRGLDELSLLVESGLGRDSVENGGNRLTIDNRDGEVCRSNGRGRDGWDA